jgi:hypothetical protein
MKHKYIIAVLLGIQMTIGLNAQQPRNQIVSKIQAQRVAFYTEKMNITPAEAEKFWPIYNEYSQKKNKITIEKNKLTKFYMASSATMTENDVDVTIKKYVELTKQETNLFEEYNKKFRTVLPAHKVMKLYLAEFQFREWLLRQIKEKKLRSDDAEE